MPTYVLVHTATNVRFSNSMITQVLLLLDVDFMISSSLNELQHSTWLQTAVSQGMLVVVPALEPVKSDAAAHEAVIRACQGIVDC